MNNDKIVIAPKGRLMFDSLPCSKPRSVIDDLLGPNPDPDAKLVYLSNPSTDDEIPLMGPQDPLYRAEFNLRPSYRTEFKLHPFQAEAVQEILDQTYEAYQRAMDRMVGDIFMVPARKFGKTVTATTATEVALRTEAMLKKLRLNAEFGRVSSPSANILYNEYATKPTSERLFPFSPHRSRRIEKKLIKRFGSVYRYEPAIWKMGHLIIAHPSFRAEIEKKLDEVTA